MQNWQNAIEQGEKARNELTTLLELPQDQRGEDYKSKLTAAKDNVLLAADEFEAIKAMDLLDSGQKAAKEAQAAHNRQPIGDTKGEITTDYKGLAAGMRNLGVGMSIEADFDWGRKFQQGRKAISRSDSAIAPGYEALESIDIRPPRLLDYLPMQPSNATSVTFRTQTTKIDAAAARAEGNALPIASFAASAVTLPFSAVGHQFDVTQEEFDDDPAFRNIMDVQAPAGVMKQLDYDVLQGSGTAPVMKGILNVTGLQTQAKGGDARALAIKKAMDKIRTNALAIPSLITLHPNDWTEIIGDLLSGTAAAASLYQSGLVPRLWGLPVVENEVLTENTGLVLATEYWPVVWRQGLTVEGTQSDGSKFGSLITTYRAYVRAVLKYRRAAAGCTVTGI